MSHKNISEDRCDRKEPSDEASERLKKYLKKAMVRVKISALLLVADIVLSLILFIASGESVSEQLIAIFGLVLVVVIEIFAMSVISLLIIIEMLKK